MASDLLLKDVHDIVMRALRKRADEHGRSIEEQAKDILDEALKRPERRSFEEVLASMPNVGDDDDFNGRRP
jgi:plasmid stability protein